MLIPHLLSPTLMRIFRQMRRRHGGRPFFQNQCFQLPLTNAWLNIASVSRMSSLTEGNAVRNNEALLLDNSSVLDYGGEMQDGNAVDLKGRTFDAQRFPSGGKKPIVNTRKAEKISQTLSDILLRSKNNNGGHNRFVIPQQEQKHLKPHHVPFSMNNKSNSGTGRCPQQESGKASQALSSHQKLFVDGNNNNDVDNDDFADLDYPQENEKSRISSTPSDPTTLGSSTLDFDLLTEALERENMSRPATSKFPPVNEKNLGRNISHQTNSQQLKINLDFLKEGTSVAPSSSKVQINDLLSKRAESLGLKNENTVSQKEDARCAVCVENLPNQMNLGHVKEALSQYGIVTGIFRIPGRKGFSECHIEFQTEEAKENALATRWLFLDGQQFPINRLDFPITTVVRISNVNAQTSENKVLSICEQCGKVDHMKMRERGTFDVYFQVKEMSNLRRILNGLNEVTVNESRWRARPAPLVHPDMKKDVLHTKEGLHWYKSQVNFLLERMDMAVRRYLIDSQDLKELNSIGK